MAKKNQVAKVKNLDCLNCGYPFFGNEVYCPECGQKNNSNKITVNSFINEVFKGFTSWDAKFWKTLFPLLTKPGKVSKDYIEGKRARYTNPFRFYITTSILFFLLLGLGNAIKNYRAFSTNKDLNKDLGVIKVTESATGEFSDGFSDGLIEELKNKPKKDTIKNAQVFGKDITRFVYFQRKHPDLLPYQALDSLNEKQTFFNKFLYQKSKTINGFSEDPKDSVNQLIKEATSHLSTALFILLPVFALFLKILYFRRKHTYIDHLIFVFHTQTVLFILLILFEFLNYFFSISESYFFTTLFMLMFLVYLFIAMKVFYNQKYFKTTIKFILTISAYTVIAFVGTSIVTLIAFVMM